MAEHALHVLALIYISEQLDAVASYFFALWRLEADDDPRLEDWLLTAEGHAHFFVANADAWRRFCQELDVAPHVMTAANYTGWFLRFRESGRHIPEPVTADRLLAGWRSRLQAMTRHEAPRDTGKGES